MKIVNPRSEYFPELQSFVATEENSLSIIKMHQVHGDRVVMVTDPHQEIGEADGMVTIVKNVVLSVCVADCGNIYAYDPIAYTIGICHSGWRSTHLNIVSKMIQSLQKL